MGVPQGKLAIIQDANPRRSVIEKVLVPIVLTPVGDVAEQRKKENKGNSSKKSQYSPVFCHQTTNEKGCFYCFWMGMHYSIVGSLDLILLLLPNLV